MELKLNLKKTMLFLAAAGMVLLVVAPFVSSHFFSGRNLNLTYRNNDNNTTYAGVLLVYGDTNDSLCNDSDRGVKPTIDGNVSWFDPHDNNSYFMRDFCDTNHSVAEWSCVKDIKVNGIQYHNYIINTRVDCNATQVCNPLAHRCM